MAEKRMFARKIIDSDAFLEMPLSAQALYFHLNMRADDDGFVNNPKRITDYVNASVDDLKILLTKRFVIGFESGVIVIRHWKIHNTILGNVDHIPIDCCSYSLLKLWQRIHCHLGFDGICGNSAQSGNHKHHSQNCREQF